MRTHGELRPIRRYRERRPGTIKHSGLRLTPACVEQLERRAEQEGLSEGATIARILEEWHATTQRKKEGPGSASPGPNQRG
jgi:hypothetical protein